MQSAKNLYAQYRAASKEFLPRAFFLFLTFVVASFLLSSFFASICTAALSALAASDTILAASFFFLFAQLFILFCIFVLQYGLFLSCLRFVRGQPVALSFLFAGFRQARAKKFAAFFVAPATVLFFLLMARPSNEIALLLTDALSAQDIQRILSDYDIQKKIVARFVAFFFLALAAYFPFAFSWPHVYDGPHKTFGTLFFESLAFWRGRFAKFLAFEFFCASKILGMILIFDFLRIFIFQKTSFFLLEFLSTILSAVSFLLVFLFFANVILSINFFYDKTRENFSEKNSSKENLTNENLLKDNSSKEK